MLLILLLFLSSQVWAYPDFIGFGYRSCMVCHENGSGGGSLTDYGRGVFASEIAANPFSKWLSDDEAAEISNFLGPVELPYWIRLGFKYRTLTVERNPGSSQSSKLYYNMQDELNLNLFANETHTLGLITTTGYIENPIALAPNKTINDNSYIYMKEYYLKYQAAKEWWVNFGFMDKVFGIKTANHTAFNRAQLGLGQNDQVHSLMVQWARPDNDVFFDVWAGNLHLPKADQAAGGSIMYEQKWGERHAYGLGLLFEKKESSAQTMFEVHNKMGFEKGNALLMELGARNEKIDLSGSTTENKTYYIFTQGNLNLTKGLFLLSGLEASKNDTGSSALESLRWDIGFLAFPIQRVELRLSGVNLKTYNATEAVQDEWSIQTQLHLSL